VRVWHGSRVSAFRRALHGRATLVRPARGRRRLEGEHACDDARFAVELELEPTNAGVQVTMTVDSMHDQVWTARLLAGRANELDNLATLIQSRR
jgi:hypothetical protein